MDMMFIWAYKRVFWYSYYKVPGNDAIVFKLRDIMVLNLDVYRPKRGEGNERVCGDVVPVIIVVYPGEWTSGTITAIGTHSTRSEGICLTDRTGFSKTWIPCDCSTVFGLSTRCVCG